MRTKEEYYQIVLKNREIANDPARTKCPCPKVRCEWHGKCKECVAIHRFRKDHIPECMQQYVNAKLRPVVEIGEMLAVDKERTSDEYRDYATEQDRKLKNIL